MLYGYSTNVIYSNYSSISPEVLFNMISGNRTFKEYMTSSDWFKCLILCVVDIKCLAVNIQNANYDKIKCNLIEIQSNSGFTVFPGPEGSTFVKTSTQFSTLPNVNHSGFNVRETLIVSNGLGAEYCFVHCLNLKSDCQGLQIQKSSVMNTTISCQILGFPLPSTVPLKADCSSDIYLRQHGEYFFRSMRGSTSFNNRSTLFLPWGRSLVCVFIIVVRLSEPLVVEKAISSQACRVPCYRAAVGYTLPRLRAS